MKDENLENSVITLYGRNWPIRRISRELCIYRERIRRLLASNSVLRDTTGNDAVKQKKKRKSKLDQYKEFITGLLESI